MNASRLFAIVVATASLVGCTANTTEPTSEEVANSAQALTLAQCATQRDTCFSANPLFGLLTCPAQYAQCTLTASNGLPAEVSAAIADTTQCAATGVDCTAGASTPAQLLDCTAAEAACVANVVDVHLPSVVTGTASCVDTSVSCIKAAKTAADLTACANALESCAVTQVETVLPPQVGTAIGQVTTCETTLNSCIAAAQTPSALTACTTAGASCVAGTLGVTLPTVPAAAVVHCTETAGSCVLDSKTVSDVTACATTLTSCVTTAVGSTPVLTCAQKWTACVGNNPLNFLVCSAQLATCKP